MNPTAATVLVQRALRQVDNGHCACHVTADQLAEVATCYLCARARLAQIAKLADEARIALADHDLSGAMERQNEIAELASHA